MTCSIPRERHETRTLILAMALAEKIGHCVEYLRPFTVQSEQVEQITYGLAGG